MGGGETSLGEDEGAAAWPRRVLGEDEDEDASVWTCMSHVQTVDSAAAMVVVV